MNDLIKDNVKEIIQLQNKIDLENQEYTTKKEKHYNFSKYSLPTVSLRDIYEEHLSLEDGDKASQ